MTTERRSLVLPLPPAWLIFNLALVLVVAGLVWYDRAETNVIVADPKVIEDLEARISVLEGQPSSVVDSSARSSVSALDARLSRTVDMALVGYIVTYARSQNLGTEASQALLERCRTWVRTGSGDFAASCQ